MTRQIAGKAGILAMLLAPAPVPGEALIRDDILHQPAPAAFSVCQDHSCASLSTQAISTQQWHSASEPLRPAAGSAAGERRAIARYIANMEKLVGPLTGTGGDVGGSFEGALRGGQMDCIDEATNTTSYLRMARSEGLLRFHRVGEPAHRGFFLFGWPHTSATLKEISTGAGYAVDSWFHDNGRPPEILPLETWKDGWQPGP